MPIDDSIIRVFCSVDDRVGHGKKHPLAKLHPSEVVTIGLLLAFKGVVCLTPQNGAFGLKSSFQGRSKCCVRTVNL